jgi:hypothetical protein
METVRVDLDVDGDAAAVKYDTSTSSQRDKRGKSYGEYAGYGSGYYVSYGDYKGKVGVDAAMKAEGEKKAECMMVSFFLEFGRDSADVWVDEAKSEAKRPRILWQV